MKAHALFLTAPREVQLRPFELAPPGEGEVLVATEVSALSAGTERLVFRGEVEPDVLLDPTLAAQPARYPLKYGYCNVGRVVKLGAQVSPSLLGARVFGFQPHQDLWVAPARSVSPLPAAMSAERGALLANTETAVSLVMDGAPVLGEAVAVVGLGIVGQLVAALLSQTSLGPLSLLDPREDRRTKARTFCHDAPLPAEGADLVYELSGRPEGLNTALASCRREGRIVVGSWYGTRATPLDLGTRVHRGRNTILFSQVSEVASALAGRFDKARRLGVAMEWLGRLPVDPLLTHRVPFSHGTEAFALLDDPPADCLQILLTYPPAQEL